MKKQSSERLRKLEAQERALAQKREDLELDLEMEQEKIKAEDDYHRLKQDLRDLEEYDAMGPRGWTRQ